MSKKKIALGALLVLGSVVGARSYGQKPTPQGRAKPAPPDPCSATRATAYREGWREGFDLGALYSATLAENAGKLKIEILTEDVADPLRLAAAEVIRGQFSDTLVVAPESDLILYITGTEPHANVQVINAKSQATMALAWFRTKVIQRSDRTEA